MRGALVLWLAICVPMPPGVGRLRADRVGAPSDLASAAADDTVTITFLGHASFEIVSPAGISAVTDYNGINIPADPPDIATMNHAHSTHYTLDPDPRHPACAARLGGKRTYAGLST